MLNIDSALRQAGASIADVVRVRYMVPDRTEFPLCWEVLRKWFGEVRPAATMLQVGLFEEAMKIEIEVTARMQGANREDENGIGKEAGVRGCLVERGKK
jgi:enamine deaminase RidA (YjgF/YER057c/UK114 family)